MLFGGFTMQSIIEKIFSDLLERENDNFQRQVPTDKEYAAYNAIYNLLNNAQRKAFDEFEEQYSMRHCEGAKELYFYGFRMGAKLAFEIMGADFTLHFP